MAQAAPVPQTMEQQIAALNNEIATVSEDLRAVEAELRQSLTPAQVANNKGVILLTERLHDLNLRRQSLLPLPAQPAQQTGPPLERNQQQTATPTQDTDAVSKALARFSATNRDVIRRACKNNYSFALVVIFGLEGEDELVRQAKDIPKTKTRVYYSKNGWHMDGVVYYGSTMFIRAFRDGQTIPWLIKVLRAEGDQAGRECRTFETLQGQFHADERLDALVPVRRLDAGVGRSETVCVYMPHYVCTLADVGTCLTLDMTLTIGRRLLGALELIWALHLYHCDVKPQNVFIDTAGVARLGDYGSVQGEVEAHPRTTLLYVPSDMSVIKASSQLDSGMLLCTLTSLLGMYSPLDGERISLHELHTRTEAVQDKDLKELLSQLVTLATGP